jgi:hypothetical protein
MVRVVAPAVVLASVLGVGVALETPTREVPPGPAYAAAAPGVLRIDYVFERQARSASNQYAIWVETADGAYVASVFATSWIAHGGWNRRPMSMPDWRAAAGWAEASDALVERVARPVPDSGPQTLYWDGLTDTGAAAPPGEYVLRIEGNVQWERRIAAEAPFTIGPVAGRTSPGTVVRDDQPADRMLTDLRATYLPGEPMAEVVPYSRGS